MKLLGGVILRHGVRYQYTDNTELHISSPGWPSDALERSICLDAWRLRGNGWGRTGPKKMDWLLVLGLLGSSNFSFLVLNGATLL